VELTLEKITTGKAIIRSSDIEAENSGVLCFLKVPQENPEASVEKGIYR
jgi:hypothetical protein